MSIFYKTNFTIKNRNPEMKIIYTVTASFVLFLYLNLNVYGQQIFSDDFESGFESSDWGVYFPNEDTLLAVEMIYAPDPLPNGGNYIGYLQDVDTTNTGAALAVAGSTDLYDYSIEADVYCYVYHPSGLSAYTGLVAYADSAVGTYIKMVADFDASQRIRLYNNHLNPITFQYSFSHDFTASDIPGGIPTESGWHKFKIEVRTISADSTAFWCYLDDQLLLGCPIYDTSEDVIGSGQFGLFSFQQDEDGIEGWFDNIVVTSLISSVEENYSNSFPVSYSLEQNYPNPFNPSTEIEFSTQKESFVKLLVYDALGREIDLLVNENKKAGTYRIIFDGSDYNSGVYFYKLQAGEYTETRKMILLK